jgi:hypothetical protein
MNAATLKFFYREHTNVAESCKFIMFIILGDTSKSSPCLCLVILSCSVPSVRIFLKLAHACTMVITIPWFINVSMHANGATLIKIMFSVPKCVAVVKLYMETR